MAKKLQSLQKIGVILLTTLCIGENYFQAHASAPSTHPMSTRSDDHRNQVVLKKISEAPGATGRKAIELVAAYRTEINKRNGNVAVFKIQATSNISGAIAHMRSMGVTIAHKTDGTGQYLIAHSDSDAHSEQHIVQVINSFHGSPVGLKVEWVYTERAPCESCSGTLEKLFPNGSSLYLSNTATIPIYSTYAWSSGMATSEKRSVARAVRGEHKAERR